MDPDPKGQLITNPAKKSGFYLDIFVVIEKK
jgi:hypothetical protein